jgi:hypothetical protein
MFQHMLQRNASDSGSSNPSSPAVNAAAATAPAVTALRAWDKARGVHVEDEPQPSG